MRAILVLNAKHFYLHDRIRNTKNEKAKEALMSLAAPFFYYTLKDNY